MKRKPARTLSALRSNTLAAIALLLLSVAVAYAQSGSGNEGKAIGVEVLGAYDQHTADFRTLPGVPSCCPRYESGDGAGVTGAVLLSLPLGSGAWSLETVLGYRSIGATLSAVEHTSIVLNDAAADATFRHSVKASIGMASLDATLGLRVLDRFDISAGPSIGYVLSNRYEQKEVLEEPSNVGAFENGKRTRNELSGDTPDPVRLQIGAGAFVKYSLPLSADGSLRAQPTLGYTRYFTPLVRSMNWHASAVSGGVAIMYRLPEPTVPLFVEDTVVQAPPGKPASIASLPIETTKAIAKDTAVTLPAKEPVAKALPQLRTSVSIAAVDENGTAVDPSAIAVEDYQRTQVVPLLSYIFFDRESATLPARYQTNVHLKTDSSVLGAYYNLLNIVGKRMRERPRTSITLTGCTSGDDEARGISTERAKAVAKYLHDTWGIAMDRLHTEGRDLPDRPSNPADPDGAVENRRVELHPSDWSLLAPIIAHDTVQVVPQVKLRVIPRLEAEAGVATSLLTVSSGATAFNVPALKESLIDLAQAIPFEHRPQPQDTVRVTLEVEDAVHQRSQDHAELIVHHATLATKQRAHRADTSISQYNLILFDFDRAELSDENRRTIDLVRKGIPNSTSVHITGYADRVGNLEYNQRLSQSRAESVQKYLHLSNARVSGAGSTLPKFDNNLPEGRFYSRTVTIIVGTP